MIPFSAVITVTVTFHPDILILRTQLSAIPAECVKVVIDNSSNKTEKQLLRELIACIPNAHFFENAMNVGLAAALNQGIKQGRMLNPQAGWCLLLDQDSEPYADSLELLLRGIFLLQQRGERVGCVGPNLIDFKTGLSHGFHKATPWYWHRVYPVKGNTDPIQCTNLNGSGSLISVDVVDELVGLDESLFIDHVDTEWSFRMLASGYTLWGIPAAVFQHRMGESSVRYWLFGCRVWPSRSPARHRFLFRNTCWLMSRNYVPFVWKFWAGIKLVLTFIVHCIFDPQRTAQVRAMLAGLREGLRGNERRSF